jgi:hypothetical protein
LGNVPSNLFWSVAGGWQHPSARQTH